MNHISFPALAAFVVGLSLLTQSAATHEGTTMAAFSDKRSLQIRGGGRKLKQQAPGMNTTMQSFNYAQSGTDWGGVCTSGVQQSPINIPSGVATNQSALPVQVDYLPQTNYSVMTSPANEWVVVPIDNNSTLKAEDGTLFFLRNIHFHQVGEHALNGDLPSIEAHFVHSTPPTASAGGLQKIAVLALPFILSANFAPDPFLDMIVPFIARGPANISTGGVLDFSDVVAPSGPPDYVTYQGSLTQPPCTEGITWYVKTMPRQASQDQVIALMSATSGVAGGARTNNRPVQPLNGRKIAGVSFTVGGGTPVMPPKAPNGY